VSARARTFTGNMRGAVAPMEASVGAQTVTSLTDETSQGVYCKRMRISALQCRQAWLGLCDFIFAQLKNQKGVSLPGLGSFAVGACVDTANGGVVEPRAPVFVLSQKFDAVPQARGRFFLTSPASYARVSTTAIAQRCGVHKAGVAHILKEMIASIAERILAGSPVDVDFSFARLVANRDAGVRVEMRFFTAFLEQQMGLAVDAPNRAGAPRERTFLPHRGEAAKARREALPAKVSSTTPNAEIKAAFARARAEDAEAFLVESKLAPVDVFAGAQGSAVFSSSTSPAAASSLRPSSARGVPSPAQAATPAGSAFLETCVRLDRLRVGRVERLRCERVLNDDACAGLVTGVPVSVVRDTLRAASCGREGKFVAYLPVCRALEAATLAAEMARAAAKETAAAWAERMKREELAKRLEAIERLETEETAIAAQRLAADAIANVVRGPRDPAEPIAEVFLSSAKKTSRNPSGNGSPSPFTAKGVDQDEVVRFNREYAAARRAFATEVDGGVAPKVTANRALELSEPPHETENELGMFLQRQIDEKTGAMRAERKGRIEAEESRNREAAASLALEKKTVAELKKKAAERLLAAWDAQTSEKRERKKNGRPPVRLVKFDALK